jgi:signal transduction histidine kinase/ActR/RegA family two-component response regulator
VPARPSLIARLKTWSHATSTGAVIAQNVVVGLAFSLLGFLALFPRLAGGERATPAWPTAGLALVAVWLLGRRVLPGIALGAILVATQLVSPPLAVLSALAPVLGVIAGVRVLQALEFDDRLERVRDSLVLVMAAGPAGALASATISAIVNFLAGTPVSALGLTWLLWTMRHWLGVASFAPLALAWMRGRPIPSTTPRLIEAGAVVIALLALIQVVLITWTGPFEDLLVAFLGLPFVVWAAFRFGARGAATIVAILTTAEIALAVIGLGQRLDLPVAMAQVGTAMFLLLAAILGQLLAAMKTERDDALAKRAHLEDQLRHSQKMEAVGRLAGGIAHDFNNLLTAIIGYTDIVLTGMAPADPHRADAEQINRAALRAAELTRHMLSFSRREKHKATVLNLNTTLVKVEPMLRRAIGEDIKLVISGKASRALVRVDAGQIEQVILNLAVNARDAMPNGGRLTVATADVVLDEISAVDIPDARLGAYVQLSVSDTGMGMSPAVRARMFEPYFTTKSAGKGTGLGLSTAYGIVRQGDGHIVVASEEGLGTTFRILLPHADAEAAVDPDSSVQKLPGGTEHVLLIEDDSSVRRLAKDLLTRLGYSVTEAASGRAAMALGSDDTRHFDLMLCDVILGDMSGPAVAEALVALRPSIRVLYMSGHTDDAIVRTGVLDEGKSFLQKPFTPVQLARKIREVLEDRETDVA